MTSLARTGLSELSGYLRLAVELTLVLYVVGLLATNFYLFSLGASDFSLFRTRFVLTGALTLLPLWLCVTELTPASILLVRQTELGYRIMTWKDGWQFLKGLLFPFFVLWLMCTFGTMSILKSLTISFILALVSSTGAAVLIMRANDLRLLATLKLDKVDITIPIRREKHDGKRAVDRTNVLKERRFTSATVLAFRLSGMVGIVSGSLLYVLLYTAIFSMYVYPAIPEQFGGAKPRAARFLFVDNSRQNVELLGLGVEGNSGMSIPVEILWQGEEYYLVRPSDGDDDLTIQLDRSIVEGAIFGSKEELYGIQFAKPTPASTPSQPLATPISTM